MAAGARKTVPTFDHVPETVTEDDADALMELATEVALEAMGGLLAAGMDPKAACVTAWNTCAVEFIKAQATFPAFLQRIYGRPANGAPMTAAAE